MKKVIFICDVCKIQDPSPTFLLHIAINLNVDQVGTTKSLEMCKPCFKKKFDEYLRDEVVNLLTNLASRSLI